MPRRLRVLVSAYACSPCKGSEPGVGWGFVHELARHHDLWVLVEEEKFRDDVSRFLVDNPEFASRVKFYFIRKQRNRWLRKLWPPSYYWYYKKWHSDAFEIAKRLHAEVHFDIAHQLTMVGFREPGYLWRLPIPFVWGPIGGMGQFPWRFMFSLGLYGLLYYVGYNLYNFMQMGFSRRPKLAARAAGVGLLVATPENLEGAKRYWGADQPRLLSEVGIPVEGVGRVSPRSGNEPLRIVWTGQHIPRKALHLGLEALARLPAQADWELHVLGVGECTERWKELADDLGIASKCKFHGWLARSDAIAVMQAGHVMLTTSLRDLTATVTIEALALGLPVVALDHCGFSAVIDDSCGIKIPVSSPRQVELDITRAILKLLHDESLRLDLSKGARIRAADFCWEEKVKVVNDVYLQKVRSLEGES